jgi:hypothetical protein
VPEVDGSAGGAASSFTALAYVERVSGTVLASEGLVDSEGVDSGIVGHSSEELLEL